MDVKVIRGAEIGTDHHLLITKYRHKKERKVNETKKIERIKKKELKNEESNLAYNELIEEKLGNLRSDGIQIEEKWEILKNLILTAAKEACGTTKARKQTKRTPWWNDEVKLVVKQKKEAWKTFLRTRREEDRDK